VLAAGAVRGSGVPLVCLFDSEVSWEIFRLPGALTCSPDEDLAAIALRLRSVDELEHAVAAGERVRRNAIQTQGLLQEARNANDDLQRTVEDLRRQLANVDTALHHAERHLAMIQASRSWRWTRPLRALFPAGPNDRVAS
jgi:hypothetical protein